MADAVKLDLLRACFVWYSMNAVATKEEGSRKVSDGATFTYKWLCFVGSTKVKEIPKVYEV